MEKTQNNMREVVINVCYGGFGLSPSAEKEFCKLKHRKSMHSWDIPRDDKHLVELVKKMGETVNGGNANLKIVEIPADIKWHIEEYDGHEHVAEDHRTWQ